MIGQTILNYRIERKIGAGGMGEVYLAEDTKLQRKVALKFLPESLHQDEEARERLAREAQAASRLSHPNIVTVHAIDEFEGRDFIAMEYVDGIPVDQYCRVSSQGLEETLGIAIGLTNGLARAHAAGITHRDLKPSNVLIEKDGRARILDFGLAKIEGATKLTKTGSTVGTVAYMSPEQGRGDEADHRSDIFSLGVILYEMITGHAPFGGDHEAAVLYAIANEEPEPLARYKKDVPDELQRVVTKCLAKRRKDRYQSAADLATDLKQIKRSLSPPSSVSTSMAATKRRKRPVAVFAVPVAAVIVIVVLLFKPWQSQSEQPAQESAVEKTLVVLPFDNLGSEEDEYFADGITDEITSRLAQIAGLHVISRTSAMQYKGTDKGLREIGDELGVAYVLEGTIRWDKTSDPSRVRITPQLIQVDNNFHVWADNYERQMTQIFAVQSDIASQIATALDVTLGGQPDQMRSTANTEAYAYFLRARELSRSSLDEFDPNAAELFEKAIALDSNFAEPYAGLALQNCYLLWDEGRGDHALRDKVDWAIRQAMNLSPDLPLAYQAQGYYYTWIERDYDRALRNYQKAESLGADKGEVLWQIAQVLMRQGRWVEAEQSLLEATKHDPRSAPVLDLLGGLYSMLKRYDDALASNQRALTLAPDIADLYSQRAQFLISGPGDTVAARQIVRRGVQRLGDLKPLLNPDNGIAFSMFRYRLMDATSEQVRRTFQHKIRRNEVVIEVFGLAIAFEGNGETDSARVYYDSLITLLEENFTKSPQDFHNLEDLTVACILAGRYDEAVEHARRGMEVMPVSTCHW